MVAVGSLLTPHPLTLPHSSGPLQPHTPLPPGTMPQVYLAKWNETLVAVKILLSANVDIDSPDDAEKALSMSNPIMLSLEKEASMMASLRHPNTVQVGRVVAGWFLLFAMASRGQCILLAVRVPGLCRGPAAAKPALPSHSPLHVCSSLASASSRPAWPLVSTSGFGESACHCPR